MPRVRVHLIMGAPNGKGGKGGRARGLNQPTRVLKARVYDKLGHLRELSDELAQLSGEILTREIRGDNNQTECKKSTKVIEAAGKISQLCVGGRAIITADANDVALAE